MTKGHSLMTEENGISSFYANGTVRITTIIHPPCSHVLVIYEIRFWVGEIWHWTGHWWILRKCFQLTWTWPIHLLGGWTCWASLGHAENFHQKLQYELSSRTTADNLDTVSFCTATTYWYTNPTRTTIKNLKKNLKRQKKSKWKTTKNSNGRQIKRQNRRQPNIQNEDIKNGRRLKKLKKS